MPPSRDSARLRYLDVFGGVRVMHAHYVRHSFSRHSHDEYAVGRIERGAMRFRFLGRDNLAAAGRINLTVPGEVHDGHGADASGWSYRMFYLAPEALILAAAEASKKRLPDFNCGVLDDPALAAHLARTHALALEDHAPQLAVESAVLRLLVNWIARHADGTARVRPARSEPRAVTRAKEYLDSHLADDVRLTQVARAAHLSPFHFLRVFQSSTGLTPHAWLVQRRVEQARRLLESSTRLADIAAATGFADQAHMTRLFKAQVGVPPGQYRKMLQGG